MSGPLVIGTFAPGWTCGAAQVPPRWSPLAGSLGDDKGPRCCSGRADPPPSPLEDRVLGLLSFAPLSPTQDSPSSLHVLVPSDRPCTRPAPAPCCQHPTLKPLPFWTAVLSESHFSAWLSLASPPSLRSYVKFSVFSFRAETKPCPPSLFIRLGSRLLAEQTVVLGHSWGLREALRGFPAACPGPFPRRSPGGRLLLLCNGAFYVPAPTMGPFTPDLVF